jgi:hypothetical protein
LWFGWAECSRAAWLSTVIHSEPASDARFCPAFNSAEARASHALSVAVTALLAPWSATGYAVRDAAGAQADAWP